MPIIVIAISIYTSFLQHQLLPESALQVPMVPKPSQSFPVPVQAVLLPAAVLFQTKPQRCHLHSVLQSDFRARCVMLQMCRFLN